MSYSYHTDENIGLAPGGVTVIEVVAESFTPPLRYWRATQPIGSILGHEVHGDLSAVGPTEEVALERLAVERKNLADSLWA